MKILITGIAGFAGSKIASSLISFHRKFEIIGLDNFSRKGTEQNIQLLSKFGDIIISGDVCSQSDLDILTPVE
jgi:CDP-paratose 2-epimerase